MIIELKGTISLALKGRMVTIPKRVDVDSIQLASFDQHSILLMYCLTCILQLISSNYLSMFQNLATMLDIALQKWLLAHKKL